MSVAACQIDQPAFAEHRQRASVGKGIAHDIVPQFRRSYRHLAQSRHIDLTVKVSGIAQDRAVLHLHKVLGIDDLVAARHGHKEITICCCLFHRHHFKSVHDGFDRLDRIDLGHDHLGSQTFGTHCHALATPAVTGNHYGLTCHDQVGGTVDAVPYGLAGTVAVIKEMLALRIVYLHHRELQLTLTVHCFETQYTGRSLLAAADHLRDQIPKLRMHHMHQIAAVIDDDIRSDAQHGTDMSVIFFRRAGMPGMHFQSVCHQCCCHIVLRGQGIGSRHIHLCPAGFQHLAQIRRLRLKMHGKRYFFSRKRFRLTEFLFQGSEQIAVVLYPFDLHRPTRRQRRIPDLTCHISYPPYCFS